MKKTKVWIITLSTAGLVLIVGLGSIYFMDDGRDQTKSCDVRRSAIDIGSGSTKLLVADIDKCAGAVKRVVHSASEKVDYKQSLLDHEQTFSADVQEQGLQILQTFLNLIHDLAAEAPLVIATAAFREAVNADEFIAKIDSRLSLHVTIVDQPTEAALGFLSVLATTHLRPEETIVWDIGGGSQQVSYYAGGEIQSLLMPWGSISYKAKVLETLHRPGNSPNPLSWEEVVQVKPLAQADFQWPSPNKKVVGIGGVFAKSLLSRLHVTNSKFHRIDLEDLLARSYFLTDEQLGGIFPETDVTNMIMVLSLMEQFGVDEIQVAETALLEGLMVYGLNGLRAER